MNRETTKKVIQTLTFVVFGAFVGVMAFLVYSEYSRGNLDLGVSIDYIKANIYTQKNYDSPKVEYFSPDSIFLDSGDILIDSYDFKLAAHSPLDLSMQGANITVNSGIFYLHAPYPVYVRFESEDVFVEVDSGVKIIVDSEKKAIVYVDQQAEQRWLVDSFTTLPLSKEEIEVEYKNVLQLLEDLGL